MRWLVNCVLVVAALVLSACCINIQPPDKNPGTGGGGATGGGSGGGAGGAGGGGGGASDPSQSGTRIKLKKAVAPDGTSTVLAFHDSQLDVDCYWQRAIDGALHCMPSNALASAYPSSYFADASCTQELVYTSGTYCTAPTVAEEIDFNACPTTYHLFQLGAEVHPGSIYFKSGSGCFSTTVSSTMHVFPLGSEISPSTYVRADANVPAGSGVVQATLRADDGMTTSWTTHDVGNDEDCYPMLLGAQTRCLPSRVGYEYGYAESTCTQRLYSVGDSACGMPRFGSGTSADGCTPKYTTLTGSSSTAYWKSGSSCTVLSGTGSTALYTGGAVVPDSTFPAATVGFVGAGRIQRRTFTWPGGLVEPYDFFDTQLGESCALWGDAVDGTKRCMPATPGLYTGSYYGDSNCSQPLVGRSGACSATPKYVYSYTAPSCTGGTYTIKSFAVGPLHGGAVYSGQPGSCSTVSSPPAVLYELGAEVPVANLAQFTVTTN